MIYKTNKTMEVHRGLKLKLDGKITIYIDNIWELGVGWAG